MDSHSSRTVARAAVVPKSLSIVKITFGFGVTSTLGSPFSFASRRPLLFLLHNPRPPISMDLTSSATLGLAINPGLKKTSLGVIGKNDLLIVGPGVLGRIVAEKWRQEHPDCQIWGQTMTTDHHDELIKSGIIPSLRGSEPYCKFPYVIFCAPPYPTTDYPGDVRLALSNWSGEGSFLFTSSTAVYDCSDNGFCNEDSPLVPVGKSPRTDVLLRAEKETLDAGGCVVRLAGLYISFLQFSMDAASLSVAIMKKKLRSQVFLGCDNHPLSRQEIMDYVNQSGRFSNKFQGFTASDGPLGKRMNNSKTRAALGWEPKFTSFSEFLGLIE
ncbi:hypothetical protein ZIOFF_017326 [Zingiber officinale]|uniref:NAD(P)-binding Rossmann-fold superfamily protein n=1 Tax=Zingiber officinale TaxID=94328 RepID=A0A8J5HBM1_ZINOF|nr:hypothetical protein ZIOFF_017326 [Zingiber officinale]